MGPGWDAHLGSIFPIYQGCGVDPQAGYIQESTNPWLVWLSGLSAGQSIAGWISSQGTCLSCGPGPQEGACERQPRTDISLPLFLPPLPLTKSE